MDTTNAPQIIEHINHSVPYTPFEVKWIPCSPRFVVCGQTPKAKGIIQIFQMNQGKLELVNEVKIKFIKLEQFNKESGFKCASFGASSFYKREIAVGDYDGYLNIYDLEKCQSSFSVKAHSSIINNMDAIGGTGNIGPAEIITAGRDGNSYKVINRICKDLGPQN